MDQYPTAGVAENPVGARVSRTLSGMTEWNRKSVFLYIHVLISLGVLVISLALVATKPSGKSNPVVSFTVFFAIFCLLGWCVLLFLLPVFKPDPETVVGWAVGIGVTTGIFNLAAALATTVRIAPGGNCADGDYTSSNDLMDGSEERCRLVLAEVAFLWASNLSQRCH